MGKRDSLSPEEIARRGPLWAALAELFLDTEMQAFHYRAIRDATRAGDFSTEQVKAILLDEVVPIIGGNLLQIAGEWAAFDPDWITERAVRYLAGRRVDHTLTGMALSWMQRSTMRSEWPRIERVLRGEDIALAMAAEPRRAPATRPVWGSVVLWAAALMVIGWIAWALTR